MPVTTSLPNAYSPEIQGGWMWRMGILIDTNGDNVVFTLPKNCVILDYALIVTSNVAAAGTVRPQIANGAGVVELAAAGHSLTAAGAFVFDRNAARVGKVTDADATEIRLFGAAMSGDAVIHFGLEVARLNYDRNATLLAP